MLLSKVMYEWGKLGKKISENLPLFLNVNSVELGTVINMIPVIYLSKTYYICQGTCCPETHETTTYASLQYICLSLNTETANSFKSFSL